MHTIRDHPNHDRPLNGGLWGGVRGCIPGGWPEEVRKFSNKQGYGGDLQFLNEVVWPRVKHDQMAHDAYTCRKYPNSQDPSDEAPGQPPHAGGGLRRHDRRQRHIADGGGPQGAEAVPRHREDGGG